MNRWTAGLHGRPKYKVASLLSYGFLAVLAVAWFPPTPAPLSPRLASWIWGLNLAHSRHLSFGRDIVFSYGPLAYLNWPHFPDASPGLFAVYVLGCYAVWIYGLYRFALAIDHVPFRAITITLFVATSALLHGVDDSMYLDRFELAFISLSMSIAAGRFRFSWIDYILLTLLTALGILLKINLGFEALLFLLSLLAATAVLYRCQARSAAVMALLLPIVVLLFYMAAGNSASAFPAYVRLSAEVAAGYSEAMSLSGPRWQLALAVASIAVAAAILLTFRQRRVLLYIAVPVFAAVLLAFKHAFVRQDTHAAAFQIEFAAYAFVALAAAATLRDRVVVLVFAAISLGAGAAVTHSVGFPVKGPLLNIATLQGFRNAAQYFKLGVIASHNSAADGSFLNGLLFLPGTVDAIAKEAVDTFSFSNSFETVLANRLKWNPRPVYEGYSAWTPALERLNADHLRETGAGVLLFNWGDLDDRYPFFSEPETWRVLVDRYDVAGFTTRVCFLRRRSSPRYQNMTLAGETLAAWNQQIDLPAAAADDLVIARINIDRSMRGLAMAALLRSASIYLEAVLRSGEKVHGRVLRSNLCNGAIVSDWPQDSEGLLALLSSSPPVRNKVRSICFRSASAWQYDRVIRIRWYRARRNSGAAWPTGLLQPEKSSLISLWQPGQNVPAINYAELLQSTPVLRVRPLAADCTLRFETGSSLRDYKTLVIRARFSMLGDRIALLFGRAREEPAAFHSSGPAPWWSLRAIPSIAGFAGVVPVARQPLDIRVSLTRNPLLIGDYGTALQLQPATEMGVGSVVEVEGIWGSRDALPSPDPLNEMQFYRVEQPR